ncbi:MAG: hypothetical protein GY807_18985, partial [Gammaproteobacteria bacterium]|nr:hypothetical protein [Gammaproteobacteria bacterium]
GDGAGSGPEFGFLRGVTLDAANSRVLVQSFSSLLAVDINSGARTILSDRNVGQGPNFFIPKDVVLDEENNRVFVVDKTLENSVILTVDLTTGDRALISDEQIGAGPLFGGAVAGVVGIALDAANQRAFVADDSFEAIFAVDLPSGDRVIVSQ